MKYLVESANGGPLIDPISGDHVAAGRPSVVRDTESMRALFAEKLAVELEKLDDEADDTEFLIAYRKDASKARADLPKVAKASPKKA